MSEKLRLPIKGKKMFFWISRLVSGSPLATTLPTPYSFVIPWRSLSVNVTWPLFTVSNQISGTPVDSNNGGLSLGH
jgi:hypothetical protein